MLLGAGTRGGHVSRALVVAAEDELGLTPTSRTGGMLGVCAEMASTLSRRLFSARYAPA